MAWISELLGPDQLIIVLLTVTLGAALQGSAGFGLGLLVSPILVIIEPRLVPGPFIVASLLLSVLMMFRERASIDLAGIRWALLGRVPGTLLAGWLLAVISQKAMILTFGGLVLLGVLISVAGLRVPPRPRNLFVAGALSAVMGTVAAMGGPPMALVYKDAPGAQLRATLAGYFVIGALFSMVTLRAIGRLGAAEFGLGVVMLPGILLGYLISSRLLPRLKQGSTRAFVIFIAAASAIFVILRELV